MEVGAPSSEKRKGHAALLLASLNLQRERAEFADCVVTQKHGPSLLYPAHRCVLAASSPVFASFLSSTGALLELQAPCLSNTILALVLDYIYTGTLPSPAGQQQYCSLLTAATYLQMAGLQEALRAGLWTKGDSDYTNTCFETCTPAQVLHLTNSPVSEARREKIKVEGEQPCSPVSAELKEVQGVTEAKDEQPKDRVEERENLCADEAKEAPWSGQQEDQRECSLREDKRRRTQGEFQRSSFVPFSASRLHLLDSPTSPCERDDDSPAFTSSTSLLSCGGVPVICHSSRATMLSGRTSPLPVSQASPQAISACKTPFRQPLKSEEGTSSKNSSWNVESESKSKSTGTHRWNYHGDYDPFTLKNMCINPDHYEILKRDYKSCFMDQYVKQNEENPIKNYGLTQLPKSNDPLVYYGSLHGDGDSTQRSHDGEPQHKEFRVFMNCGDYEENSEAPFNQLLSKQQEVCSDIKDVSMATAEEVQSSDCLDQSSFICANVDIKSEHHWDDQYPREKREEEEEEDGDSSRRGGKDCASSRDGIQTEKMDPGLARTDINRTHEEVSLHRTESGSILTTETIENASCPPRVAYIHRRDGTDVCLPACTTPEPRPSDARGTLLCNQTRKEDGGTKPSPSLEYLSNISNSENKATPVVSSLSTSASSAADQSYQGRLHYHCISPALTDIKHPVLYAPSQHKHYPLHLPSVHGDEANVVEEIESRSNVGYDPLRQLHGNGSGTQFLLLDISTNPAQLLVSQRAEGGGTIVTVKHGIGVEGDGFGDDYQKQSPEATFGAVIDEMSLGTVNKSGSGDEHTSGTSVEERGCKEQAFDAGGEATGDSRAVSGDLGEERGFSYEAVAKVEGTGLTSSLPTWVPTNVGAPTSSTASGSTPAPFPPSLQTYTQPPVHQFYQCSRCERSFSQRGSLNRHMRSHLGVRPYPCPRCPMTFSRQYRVTEHMRVHLRCSVGGGAPQAPSSSYT